MGLDILPKAGINFKASYGAGNFKRKLDKLTYYQGGEFGMLRNNRQAIEAAIAKRTGAIKLKGGLDRMQRKGALLEIMKNDKTLTKADKYKVKELLEYYARGNKPTAAAVKKPLVNIERDESALVSKRPDFAHVSNDNYFRSGESAAGAGLPSGAYHHGVSRGQEARNAINYANSQRLGSGPVARNLQKTAFAKLQESSKPGKISGRAGSDLLHSLN